MNFTVVAAAQRSPAWFSARCGRLTGSRARALLAKRPDGEALTRSAYRRLLVQERYTGTPAPDGFVSAAMRRGFEQEPAAIRAYEVETGDLVSRSGFLAHTTLAAGCSLDGHVGRFAGILEVKNPDTATHLDYQLGCRLPPAHVAQVTHNLWISGAPWCDFVSFDDRCGPSCRLFIVRVQAVDVDLVGYARKAVTFLAEVDRELRALTDLAPRARRATSAVSHFIPYDAPGGARDARAECGATVARAAHANAPTCRICLERRAAYEAMDFGQVCQ